MRVYGFPGQGSQVRGMGRDLFEQFPDETRFSDVILGYSIRSLCLEDDSGRLDQSEYTQPAMYVVGALTYLARTHDDPVDPDFLIGHSLGEYVALFAGGAFNYETGLKFVQRRGELMSRAPAGGMAAVIGCKAEAVEAMFRESGVTSIDIANLNTEHQTVVAGPREDIERLKPVVESRGARYVRLNVSAPFHSRYMRSVADEFGQFLAEVEFQPLRIPVIANVTGRPYRNGQVRETLVRQIANPVNWLDSIRYLVREGDFTFAELGPGNVLTRLVQQIRGRYGLR
jgi:trans-AT polyketide synthase/acyltransferase/oxidoreductase domain-containing protein